MTLDPIREFIAPYLLWIKLGLAAAALVAILLLGWRIHHAGYESGIAHDAAKVTEAEARATAAESANATNIKAIAALKAANADWAARAAASEAREAQAVQDVANQRKASSAALERVNRKLAEAINANQSTAAWGRACVPAGIWAAGGVQPGAGCPH